MSRKRKVQTSKTAPVHRPGTFATYASQAAAGAYATERATTVSASWPPLVAMGDTLHPASLIVTQLSYQLILPGADTVEFQGGTPGTSLRLGGLNGFGDFGPIAQGGEPDVWSDDNDDVQQAWEYLNGNWRTTADAPIVTGAIHMNISFTVPTSDVDIRVSLWDESGPSMIDETGDLLIRNINSPTTYALWLGIDKRQSQAGQSTSYTRWRVLPNNYYSLRLTRWDAGAVTNVTLNSCRAQLISLGIR